GPIRSGGDLTPAPRIVASVGGPGAEPIELDVADLDAYVLGLVLSRVATAEHRSHLGVEGGHEAAQDYAFSLHPDRRLEVLRALAGEMLSADPVPPKALRSMLAA
ncbi:MAG: hypothetical protein QOC64_2035, partial [Solirubrobacteraceae bacterium]|nr:hypothetical protein [Solirubrobacteraceae bacterium]